MLENSLYRKFERELDRIALPDPELWFPAGGKRTGGAPRIVAAIAVTTLVIGLIFASQRFTGQPKSEVATETQGEVLSPGAKYPIHIPGSISATGPAALDACKLIAHAAFNLGFGSLPPMVGFRTVPEGVVFEHADGPWGSHPCAFGYDQGWESAHLLVRPVATRQAEVGALLPETFADDRAGNPIWIPDGPDTWIANGAGTSSSAPWVAVAVSAEPYLLVVTGPNEETARKLMQGVLDQLETP